MSHLLSTDYALAINYADNSRCALGCCKATVKALMAANARGSLAGRMNPKDGTFDIRTVSNNPHEEFTLRGFVPAYEIEEYCTGCGRSHSEHFFSGCGKFESA